MSKDSEHPVVAKIDKGINKAVRWFSYLGGIALIITAAMLFVNVVMSKIFGAAMSNVNELVEYLLIAIVYCCVADCQLNGGGVIQVDIFYGKFPYTLKKIIKGIAYIAGTIVYLFAAYQALSLLNKHFTYKVTAASSTSSFQIWPFTLLYIIGTVVFAISLLWSVFRMFFLERPETELGPGDYDLDEMNVKGKLFKDADFGEEKEEEV